jgi:hypothetical protein
VKIVVYRMAKRKMKNSTIIYKLIMEGIELNRDVMATFNPSFLEISLNGLRILSILRDLMKEMSTSSPTMMPVRAESTMTKSRMFHGSFR